MKKKLRITVEGKVYDVTVEVLGEDSPQAASRPSIASPGPSAPMPPPSTPGPSAPSATGPGQVASPMAGSVKSVLVKQGEKVDAGQALLVLEAMKMENRIAAPKAGSVKAVHVVDGEAVQEGKLLIEID